MDKQSRFKETKSSEGAFEERDFYRESLSKLRLVRELQNLSRTGYIERSSRGFKMKSWHCRHCGTPRDKFRPSLRAWKLEKLLLEVRNLVIAVESGKYITAEDIATKLRAKKSMVEQCFHRLNLEGILSQGYNIPPHDSTRDRYVWGVGDSSWQATLYMKNETEQ